MAYIFHLILLGIIQFDHIVDQEDRGGGRKYILYNGQIMLAKCEKSSISQITCFVCLRQPKGC